MIYIFLTILLLTFLYSYFTKQINEDGSIKVIKRSSWQYRLIRWTIDRDPNFKGYCPFFWSVWACIFLIPATVFIKTVKAGTILFNPQGATSEEKSWKPSSPMMVYIYDGIGKEDWYFNEQVKKWMAETPNWKEICTQAYRKQEKKDKIQEKKEQNRAARDEFIEKLSDKLGFLFKPATAAAIISIGLWLVYSLYCVVSSIAGATSLIDIVYALVFIFSGIAIVYGVKFLYRWLKKAAVVVDKFSSDSDSDEVEGFMYKFWQVIAAPFKLIARLYKKECPIAKMED